MNGHQVVLAHAVDGDVADHDHLVVAGLEGDAQVVAGILVQPREDLGVHVGDPERRVAGGRPDRGPLRSPPGSPGRPARCGACRSTSARPGRCRWRCRPADGPRRPDAESRVVPFWLCVLRHRRGRPGAVAAAVPLRLAAAARCAVAAVAARCSASGAGAGRSAVAAAAGLPWPFTAAPAASRTPAGPEPTHGRQRPDDRHELGGVEGLLLDQGGGQSVEGRPGAG